METLLIIAGLFLVLFIGKFIYDTYLTNNTEVDWQKYKLENPIDAARIEGKEILDKETEENSIGQSSYQKGIMYLEEKEYKLAYLEFNKALEENPDDFDYQSKRSSALTKFYLEHSEKSNKDNLGYRFPTLIELVMVELGGAPEIEKESQEEVYYKVDLGDDYNPLIKANVHQGELHFGIYREKETGDYFFHGYRILRYNGKAHREQGGKVRIGATSYNAMNSYLSKVFEEWF